MRHLARGLAVATLLCSPALAQRVSNVDGRKLQAFCTGANPTACDAYIGGITDAIAEQPGGALAACIKPGVSAAQLRQTVVTYLHDHPRDLGVHAAHLAVHALVAAFPCR